LIKFIFELRTNQSIVEQTIKKLFALPEKNINKKYAEKMTNIKSIVRNYEKYTGLQYLEAIAFTYNWHFK
jgi:hypothetical protein